MFNQKRQAMCPLSPLLLKKKKKKSVAATFVRAQDQDGAGNQSWCSACPQFHRPETVTFRVRLSSTCQAGRGISAHILHDLGTETPDGLRSNIAGLRPTFISIFTSFYISFFRGEEQKERNASSQETG